MGISSFLLHRFSLNVYIGSASSSDETAELPLLVRFVAEEPRESYLRQVFTHLMFINGLQLKRCQHFLHMPEKSFAT